MPDREKVISGLKYCLDRSEEKVHCGDCPYWQDDFESGCHIYDMMRDALALLKEQTERIQFLEKWTAYLEGGDPLSHAATREIIEILKNSLNEQEARVITLEEVKQHDNQDGCVWFEQPTYNAVAAFVRQDEECTEIISPYLLGEPINHGYMCNTFYAKAWRAWTSRPSEQQMQETKWEEAENANMR